MNDFPPLLLPPQRCPHCGALVESGQDGQEYDPGYFLLCSTCACYLIYGNDQQLREATEEDFSALSHQVRNHFNTLRLKLVVELEKARLKSRSVS
jgi:hypothetical protein